MAGKIIYKLWDVYIYIHICVYIYIYIYIYIYHHLQLESPFWGVVSGKNPGPLMILPATCQQPCWLWKRAMFHDPKNLSDIPSAGRYHVLLQIMVCIEWHITAILKLIDISHASIYLSIYPSIYVSNYVCIYIYISWYQLCYTISHHIPSSPII